MRIALYIFASLIGVGLLMYFFIIRPAQKKSQLEGNPPQQPIHGNETDLPSVIEEQISLPSLAVKESDAVTANDPATYFSGMFDANANSYNIHTAPDAVRPLIHFITSFGKPCPAYVWYKYGLYTFMNNKTDDQGNKTCYYKFDKSVLPAKIEIRNTAPPYQCTQFKYYISGVEYKFKETKSTTSMGGPKHFCIYEKQ